MRFSLTLLKTLLIMLLLILGITTDCTANTTSKLDIDTFSHHQTNNLGYPRVYMNDSMTGGQTTATHTLINNTLQIKGDIIPPRGQPGWISTVFPVANEGAVRDVSQYKGVLIKVKLTHGNLSVSVNSSEIDNFDFHASQAVVPMDGQFHTIALPFAKMKRAWSEQTVLNTSNINSISIVAYDLQKASVDFTIDEVSLY